MEIGHAGPDAPNAAGCYIFGGGSSIGASHHFNLTVHLEESFYGAKTSQTNFPDLEVFRQPSHWPIEQLKRRDIRYLYCNPPCALFSQAGACMRGGGDAWKTDPRQRCWRNCFVAFEALRPDVFSLESVCQAFERGRQFVDDFAHMALDMGYSATFLLVDARNYGMAQRRKRFFLVLHRVALDFDLPDYPLPTVNEVLGDMRGGPGWVTPWTNPTHEALIPFLQHGESFREMWEQFNSTEDCPRNAQGGLIGRPRIFIHRVNGEGLIGTITGDYFVHPTDDRFLGMNELKVLNGFPEDYYLEGAPKSHASLIARGVCPNVSEWLSRAVRRGIDRGIPTSGEVRTIDLREPRSHDTRVS